MCAREPMARMMKEGRSGVPAATPSPVNSSSVWKAQWYRVYVCFSIFVKLNSLDVHSSASYRPPPQCTPVI